MTGCYNFCMIYVNRLDNQSRKEAVSIMERVLRAGNSVLLFPEGGYQGIYRLEIRIHGEAKVWRSLERKDGLNEEEYQ